MLNSSDILKLLEIIKKSNCTEIKQIIYMLADEFALKQGKENKLQSNEYLNNVFFRKNKDEDVKNGKQN